MAFSLHTIKKIITDCLVSLKPTDTLLFTVILKQIKIILYTPTCFGPRWDHPQGVLSVLG
jgi:hypothetical protein